MTKTLISAAKPAEKHLTIAEAEELAAKTITDPRSALLEATIMLAAIARGKSYGTFEYIAKLTQMRLMLDRMPHTVEPR